MSPSTDLEASKPPNRGLRWVASISAAMGIVALYLWDDVLLAAPIIAAARWLGPGGAFVLCTPIFFLASTLLAFGAARAYEMASRGRSSRLERWLEQQASGRRGNLADRLLRTTGVISFVASSVLLGGTVTTWLIRYGGRRDSIWLVAVTSSAINAVSFVGMYTGLFGILF